MKMMNGKLLKCVVSMILVLCLVMSNAGPVLALDLFADGSMNYVALGSSTAAGFGLTDEKDAYPQQVLEALNKKGYDATLTNLAMNYMRAEELHVLLDDTYEGDAYTADRFLGDDGIFAKLGGLEELRKQYQSIIADADFITLDIGANNFSTYIVDQIISGGNKYPIDMTAVMEPGMSSVFNMAKQAILDAVFSDPAIEDSPAVDAIIDSMLYAMMGYITHFDAVLAAIYELNPDVQIVVVGFQNPMTDLSIEVSGVELDLSNSYSALLEVANYYAAAGSAYSNKYYFAAIDEQLPIFLNELKSYNGDPATLTQNLKDCFNIYDSVQVESTVQKQFDAYLASKGEELTGPYEKNEDYQRALAAAYDTVAKILQIGANTKKADLYGIITDYDQTESMLRNLISDHLEKSIQGALADPSFTYKPDVTISKDVAYSAVLALGVRFYIGDGFFTHPTAEGHASITKSILTALEKQIKGEDAVEIDMGTIVDKLMGEGSKIYEDATSTGYFPTKNSYYVALGDGSAASYYMKDKNDNNVLVNSYPYYIQQHFGVNHLDLTEKDKGAVDSHDIIKNNAESIAKADLITLSYSLNTFTTKMSTELNTMLSAQGVVEHDWSLYLDDEMIAMLEQILEDMRQELVAKGLDKPYMTGVTFADIGVFVMESYMYQLIEHMNHYPQVIEEVRAINPDAQIVLVGMTNTMAGHELDMSGSMFALGDYMQYVVEAANAHYRLIAITNPDVIFVDVPDGEWQPLSEKKTDKVHKMVTFVAQLSKLKGDFFTSVPETYEKQAEVIIKALSVNHFGDVDDDGDVDNFDAMKILQKFVGLSSAAGINLENADVDRDGDVDNFDAMIVLQKFVGIVPALPVIK